jgi:hypothetical protein
VGAARHTAEGPGKVLKSSASPEPQKYDERYYVEGGYWEDSRENPCIRSTQASFQVHQECMLDSPAWSCQETPEGIASDS